MNAGGKIASSLFTTLCLAGILTFFAQEGTPEFTPGAAQPGGRTTALDPSEEKSPDWTEVVPAAFEDGARVHAGQAAFEAPRLGTRLKLR